MSEPTAVPELAKLLYRLWQNSQMTLYDAELDAAIVTALQPWADELKKEFPE